METMNDDDDEDDAVEEGGEEGAIVAASPNHDDDEEGPDLDEREVEQTVRNLQRVTSGSSRTDVLAGAIGLQLFTRPTQAAALARNWVHNLIPYQGSLTMPVCFIYLLHALVEGTTQGCDLAIYLHDTGDEESPIVYEARARAHLFFSTPFMPQILLFPSAYNMGITRHWFVAALASTSLEALGCLLNPLGVVSMDEGHAPFLHVTESGSLGQWEVRNFTGNRVLGMLYNPAYFIHLACVAWVDVLAELHTEIFASVPLLFHEIITHVVIAMRRLSETARAAELDDVANELSNLSQILADHAHATAPELAIALESRTAWWTTRATHVHWLVRAALRRLGPQPIIDPSLDPAWLVRAPH